MILEREEWGGTTVECQKCYWFVIICVKFSFFQKYQFMQCGLVFWSNSSGPWNWYMSRNFDLSVKVLTNQLWISIFQSVFLNNWLIKPMHTLSSLSVLKRIWFTSIRIRSHTGIVLNFVTHAANYFKDQPCPKSQTIMHTRSVSANESNFNDLYRP